MLSVQVFIPNYNGAKFLRETIDSLLAQNFESFEIYLIDNNSTDNSMEIMAAYQDSRLKVLKYDVTCSMAENFNRCLKLVTAKYFCLAHTDDVYEPDYLKQMYAALIANETALMAHSNFKCISTNGNVIEDGKYKVKKKLFSLTQQFSSMDPKIEINKLICGNYIICPSMFFNKKIINEIGLFNEKLSFALDWDYSLRILKANFNIVRVSAELINYRISDTNSTTGAVKSNLKYIEHLTILKQYQSNLPATIIKRSNDSLKKVLLWDIKEDLLASNFELAHLKFDFVKTNLKMSFLLNNLLRIAIKMGRYGGLVLDNCAKAIIAFSNS